MPRPQSSQDAPACRSAKCPDGEKWKRFADAGGLYLEVSKTGAKSWRWKYRFEGKEKRLSLGLYPAVSLSQARQQRDAARATLGEGGRSQCGQTQAYRGRQERIAPLFEACARRDVEGALRLASGQLDYLHAHLMSLLPGAGAGTGDAVPKKPRRRAA